jgi:hypothetical protein
MKSTQILLPVAAFIATLTLIFTATFAAAQTSQSHFPAFQTTEITSTETQISPQVQKLLAPVSQMIDANTFLVGHVDLSRIDVETSAATLKTHVAAIAEKLLFHPAASEDKEEFQRTLQFAFQQLDIWTNRMNARIAEIRALGCNEIYILGNSKIMTITPLQFVLPASEDKLEHLEKTLAFPEDSPVGWVFQQNGDLLVANLTTPFSSASFDDANIGHRVAFQHKLIRPSLRQEFAAGLERVKNAPIKVVLAPDGVIRGLWQILPGTYPVFFNLHNGDYNTRNVISLISNLSGFAAAGTHLQWCAMGLDPARLMFALTVQAKSPEGAQELHDLIVRQKTLIALFVNLMEQQRGRANRSYDVNYPLINVNAALDIAMFFLPDVRGDQLRLVVDQKRLQNAAEQTVEAYSTVILPSMENKHKTECVNNMKKILLAMHTYQDATKALPTAYTTNQEGKPMLSWRVALLPYIEEAGLYNEIMQERSQHPDESWEGEHFKKFHDRCPKVYQCPSVKGQSPGMTNYSVIVGKITSKEQAEALGLRFVETRSLNANDMNMTSSGMRRSVPVNNSSSSNLLGVSSGFPEPNKWHTFAFITDGTSNTIAVVERKEPVCWMDPSQEITLEDAIKFYNTAESKVGSPHKGGFFYALFDGSVHFWETAKIPIEIWKAVLTSNGGETVSMPR